MSETKSAVPPRLVRMHPADNVAIVVNEGGLPSGTLLEGGLILLDKVPQGHKVTLVALAQGDNDVEVKTKRRLCGSGWVRLAGKKRRGGLTSGLRPPLRGLLGRI